MEAVSGCAARVQIEGASAKNFCEFARCFVHYNQAADEYPHPRAARLVRVVACEELVMQWHKPLTFVITPKSGPLRQMTTLLDANHALSGDLPLRYLRRPHWLRAGKALLQAAETDDPICIRLAFEEIVAALEHEGWMTRARPADDPLEEREYAAPQAPAPAVADEGPRRRSENVIPFRRPQRRERRGASETRVNAESPASARITL